MYAVVWNNAPSAAGPVGQRMVYLGDEPFGDEENFLAKDLGKAVRRIQLLTKSFPKNDYRLYALAEVDLTQIF